MVYASNDTRITTVYQKSYTSYLRYLVPWNTDLCSHNLFAVVFLGSIYM